MQYLRALARQNHDFHAYVLPGKTPAKSIGCFKRFATDTDGLPDMILLGADRNIETFNVNNKAQTPSTVEAATLSIAHDKVQKSTASYRNATLMGDNAPDASDPTPATRLLPPGQTDRVDLENATKGAAADSGFSLAATGTIVPISDSPYSAKYLISQVTHTLTRSIYTQSFAMKGNAVTSGGGAGGPQPSALLSAGFNIQLSIF
jgi:hypothetical protein